MWINPNTLEVSNEPADGYEPILSTQCPLTERLEKAVPGAPELVDGMWYETWVLEPLTEAEEAQVIEAERVNAGNLQQQYTAALELHYDTTAQTKRYDNRLTCTLRAGYPGPYQTEALSFAIWMDTCNELAYKALGEVNAGIRSAPSIKEFLQELPAMIWA